jgi:hypothetical protein
LTGHDDDMVWVNVHDWDDRQAIPDLERRIFGYFAKKDGKISFWLMYQRKEPIGRR